MYHIRSVLKRACAYLIHRDDQNTGKNKEKWRCWDEKERKKASKGEAA